MKLEKPSLPVSIPKEDLLAQIKDAAMEKNWREEDIQIGEPVLVYTPFFVFSYEAFSEAATEETASPVVSEIENGRNSINAFSADLDEHVAELFEEEELNLEKKTPKEYAFELQKARINEEEAKQLAQVKLAAQLQVGKENIIISGLEMVFSPAWVVEATVAEQSYRVQVDAVSGEMSGLEELPERGKGYGELTKETLVELKSPVAWVKYSVSIVVDIAKWIANFAPVKFFLNQLKTNRRFQIAVPFFVLVIIFLKDQGYI